VNLIKEAKRRGVDVSAEVTPHHLALVDADLQGYDPVYRVSPPLRSLEDREALRLGLQDGTIDVIATDHAPHTREEKHREFALAPTGMIGFETALGVVWTELVATNRLTKEELVRKMAVNPAKILNQPGGRLLPGDPADVIMIDPLLEWEVKAAEFVSQSQNSPFIGRKLTGKVQFAWVDGVIKMNDKIIV
jgi:dihydroorotase